MNGLTTQKLLTQIAWTRNLYLNYGFIVKTS